MEFKEVPPKPLPRVFQLTMTEAEAKVLHLILRHIGGNTKTWHMRVLEDLRQAMVAEGVGVADAYNSGSIELLRTDAL